MRLLHPIIDTTTLKVVAMGHPSDQVTVDASASKLFQPIRVGDITLGHRVVFAPLTRFRHTKTDHVALPIVKEYYAQRASTPGTLLISEATLISPEAGGYIHAPGIWSDEQISKWKEVRAKRFSAP